MGSRAVHFFSRRFSTRWLVTGVLVILVCVVAVGLTGRRTSSSDRLRKYREALRAQGEKLTYAELMGTNRPSSGASFTNFRVAVASLHGKLGPSAFGYRIEVRPGFARSLCGEAGASLDTNSQWIEFNAEMVTNQVQFDALRELLQDPPEDSGAVLTNLTTSKLLTANYIALRIGAQWLAAATVADMRAGRAEEATQNLEALCALARMNRAELVLVSQMIRQAIASLGMAVTWELLQARRLDEQQLKQLAQAWDQLDLLATVESGLAGERAVQSDSWQAMRFPARLAGPVPSIVAGLFEDYVWAPAYRLSAMNDDLLFQIQGMQQMLDSIRIVRRRLPYAGAQAIQSQLGRKLRLKSGPVSKYLYSFSLISLPNYQRIVPNAVHAETERQMTLAAIGLERYRIRHQDLPESLSELVPEFLREEPWDYLAAAPLRYRRLPEGEFFLYSIGEDGKDDGGDPTPAKSTAVSIWDARDAVWPRVWRETRALGTNSEPGLEKR